MITEKDLKSLKTDEEEINRLKVRIADLREEARSLTQTMSDMPRGGRSDDKMASFAAQIDSLQRTFGEKLAALQNKRIRIDAEVDTLPEQQKRIIRLRFYDKMSWRKISRITHYSESHCRKIKDSAIRRLSGEQNHSS